MKSASEILTSHNKFHINLGLDRISAVMKLLGNPQNEYKVIHIAGTNGKGSTSKIINEILFESGFKVGLFTSPHLFSYTERLKVNNEEISQYVFDKLVNEIDLLAKKNNIELSEFELITAVAFYYFYIKKVDYLILEVGLGGLYDATNVVENSTSVITTIDYDHTERLGKTIEEIALQKAGIIKQNSNLAILKDNLGFKLIEKIAQEKNAKIIELPEVKVVFEDKNYAIIENEKFEFNLLGAHQAQNLALALGVVNSLGLNIEKDSIKNALKNVIWPFRLEYYENKNILIDAAHNPSGAITLRTFLDENFKDRKKNFIFGCLKNKDYEKMLDILIKDNDSLYFCEFDYPNALKYADISKRFEAVKINNINEIENIEGLKIFCGSIYMLGKVLKTYQYDK
ncbi:MAG: bifunctional folylpolyglutamate synthase/dihydrofolate synthase [Candidatus Gastranaerophilales bacterium]|nr:bifunctional folylpolyglutamate synthase/dihydrofolate synthase [Candidatus Gastranaerophilales bacterium]